MIQEPERELTGRKTRVDSTRRTEISRRLEELGSVWLFSLSPVTVRSDLT